VGTAVDADGGSVNVGMEVVSIADDCNVLCFDIALLAVDTMWTADGELRFALTPVFDAVAPDADEIASLDARTSPVVIDVVSAALLVIEPGPSTFGGVVLVHPVTTTRPATASTAPRNPRITLLPDGFPPLASGTPSTTDRADTLTTCDDPRARREHPCG